MMDRRRIVQQWKRSPSAALVTLIRAEGSSYRAPGAHLLIASNGEYSGSMSGGCLEAEVVRKAAWMVRHGAIVERYSTFFDDTAEIPYGLGCGGVVDLLIEPADTPECRALVDALAASLGGEESSVVSWLPAKGKPLRRAVISNSDQLIFASDNLTSEEIASSNNPAPIDDPSIYIEQLHQPLRLFILGAGDDAKSVVTIAALLGWTVIVADGRAHLARRERFPDADRVLSSTSIANLGVTTRDAVVIMTHSYEQDRAVLTGLLQTHSIPGYIGLLGASHRSSLLVSEVATALGRTLADCCERIWSPVGLDLGGEGPEAIALAVVAEIQAWQNGKLAASRRLTAPQVEEQIATRKSSPYLQPHCSTK